MTTVKTTLFNPPTKAESDFLLSSHLPPGKVWSGAYDPESNLYKLIAGLGVELYRLQFMLQHVSIEMDINQASDLILEWEESVGIPNDYFSTNATLEQRRNQVIQLFSNFGGVQTVEDFERVALFFGFTVDVLPGVALGSFPLGFPVMIFASSKVVKHTIIIVTSDITGDSFFPLPFPVPITLGGNTFLRIIFEVLAPANVQILIINET